VNAGLFLRRLAKIMATLSGLVTGLKGYSLKKEMFGDSLFYRELKTFHYGVYSVSPSYSRSGIQNAIKDEFAARYSGDINVKVFQQPVDYVFPNDGVRASRYDVEVQVRSIPSLITWQPELNSSNYYKGLGTGFFSMYGVPLIDFKETFDFDRGENGNKSFSHNCSFVLLSGNKSVAASLVNSIFSQDTGTTFGINVMPNAVGIMADSGQTLNYYSETYDTIRQSYSFARKREFLPLGTVPYVYNLTHLLELGDDGMTNVTEKGVVKGLLNFNQSKAGATTLVSQAYPRCAGFLNTYYILAGTNTSALIASPTKTITTFNRPMAETNYEISFTNNPQFKDDGIIADETMDISELQLGIFNIKHSFNWTRGKRVASRTFSNLMTEATASSLQTVNGYMATSFSQYISSLHAVKREYVWPNVKNKGARASFEYNSHPKYFVLLSGLLFQMLEPKITHTKPVDIVTEYKIINRPTKQSVINYAYQTEKGQIGISLAAGIGRKPDEFTSGFRNDLGNYVHVLFRYGSQLFLDEFKGTIPMSFTYYLNDAKYVYNSEAGQLELTLTFVYSIKKRAP